jgi:7,8-dihydropterin-6-yl-methyl-4-(beta-D-ribofuranosyl)aminobenzene 5'-phosphate synthase
MKITCIIDNRAGFKSNLYAEHGFSLLVEHDDKTIMVDTGKTPLVMRHNLDVLGITTVEEVLISHGHNDHTGGLAALLDSKINIHPNETKFYMHPQALTPKYAVEDDEKRYIGFPETVDPETLNREWVTENTSLGKDTWIFNQVEYQCGFEPIPPYLRVEVGGKLLPDKFEDEINMVMKTDEGLVVFSGCAHKGIVNILYSVKEYFQDEIYAVIGGSHLMNAPPQRIENTVEAIKKLNPGVIAMGHCTGFEALCHFKREFGDKFIPLASGVGFQL